MCRERDSVYLDGREGALISPVVKKLRFAEALPPVTWHLNEMSPLAFGSELPSVKGVGVARSLTGDTRSNSTHTPCIPTTHTHILLTVLETPHPVSLALSLVTSMPQGCWEQ